MAKYELEFKLQVVTEALADRGRAGRQPAHAGGACPRVTTGMTAAAMMSTVTTSAPRGPVRPRPRWRTDPSREQLLLRDGRGEPHRVAAGSRPGRSQAALVPLRRGRPAAGRRQPQLERPALQLRRSGQPHQRHEPHGQADDRAERAEPDADGERSADAVRRGRQPAGGRSAPVRLGCRAPADPHPLQGASGQGNALRLRRPGPPDGDHGSGRHGHDRDALRMVRRGDLPEA